MSDMDEPDPIEWKPWWSWSIAVVAIVIVAAVLLAIWRAI